VPEPSVSIAEFATLHDGEVAAAYLRSGGHTVNLQPLYGALPHRQPNPPCALLVPVDEVDQAVNALAAAGIDRGLPDETEAVLNWRPAAVVVGGLVVFLVLILVIAAFADRLSV